MKPPRGVLQNTGYDSGRWWCPDFSFLCASFVPLWWILSAIANHIDTEHTKDAQRLNSNNYTTHQVTTLKSVTVQMDNV